MATEILVTCDVCGAVATRTIRFTAVDVRSTFSDHIDLCFDHWKPWRDFMSANHPKYVAAAKAERDEVARALAISEKEKIA